MMDARTPKESLADSTDGFDDRQRILIVDDDIHVVQMLRTNLESEGYKVLFATDAPTGQQLAWDQQPDLIVSDIAMPGVDGLTMVAAIFQRPGIKKMPVIFVSGEVASDFRPDQKELPVPFAVMKKPLFLPEFNLLVRQFLAPRLSR
jgi:CheY-like chemotaxis protein